MLLRREIAPGEYVTEVNSDVRSQRSLQIVGGADFNFRAFGRPFKFSAEAYYKALSKINPYEVENLTVTYLGRNAASAMWPVLISNFSDNSWPVAIRGSVSG